MGKLPHRIRRQRWHLQAGSAAAAFALRQRVRDEWQDLFLPAFETVFDQEVPTADALHIPQIELTLRIGPEEKTDESWGAVVQEQLLLQLREILRARRDTTAERLEWKESTAQQNRFQSLLRYLDSGSLPWASAGIAADAVAAELRETCREQWTRLLRTMRAGAPPSFSFCFRLLQLLPPIEAGPAAASIIRQTRPSPEAPMLDILASLLAPEQKHFGRCDQLQLAAIFLSEGLSSRPGDSISDFVAAAGRALSLEVEALEAFIASVPASARSGAIADSVSRKTAPATDNRRKLPGAERMPRPMVKLRRALSPEMPGVFRKQERSERSFPEKEATSVEAPEEADFPLLANHGGLILLHPFLSAFFERTGVKEKGDAQLSRSALARGAALLHFVATGEDSVYEYELVFIKVLLGLDPGAGLCVSEGLVVAADVEEANAVLLAAIAHWTALKNTSIAGFRSSFLNRPGLLRNEELGWKFQIERQPYDLLLEHLPWSISVVKLPWMERPLFTEW